MSSNGWSGTRIDTRVSDIFKAVTRIKKYLEGFDRDAFDADDKTKAAIEREIEIVSDACSKIQAIEESLGLAIERTLESRYPRVAWAKIRGIGNILRHEYGRVDSRIIWDTAADSTKLDDLVVALRAEFPGIA